MKSLTVRKKYFRGPQFLWTAFLSLFAGSAFASDLTDSVNTAISSAKGDALTVGGYVVAAIAALIVVTLVIGMVRKL